MSSVASSRQEGPTGPKKSKKREPPRHFRNKNKANVKEESKENADKSKNQAQSSKPKSNSNYHRKRERSKKKKESNNGFKLVLRHLPPNLTSENFMESLKPVIQEKDLSSFHIIDHYFKNGEESTNLFEKATYSRAYFTFSTMDQLKLFGNKVQNITFIDDKDNATKPVLRVSPYVKRLGNLNVKKKNNTKKLEGTIENNDLFKNFLKTMELMNDKGNSPYLYNDISILKPLAKELAREKEHQTIIEKKTRMALIKLSGASDKGSKKKKKKKNKSVATSTGTGSVDDSVKPKKKESKSRKKKAREKKEKKIKNDGSNQNVVILEEAGKRELQKRKKLMQQKEKEAKAKETQNTLIAKAIEKKKLLRKAKMEVESTQSSQNTKSAMKILKRDEF